MQYMMTDHLGRQVGNTTESYTPLAIMGRRLNEKNDLVIWEIDPSGVRRVIGVVTKSQGDKVKSFRV